MSPVGRGDGSQASSDGTSCGCGTVCSDVAVGEVKHASVGDGCYAAVTSTKSTQPAAGAQPLAKQDAPSRSDTTCPTGTPPASGAQPAQSAHHFGYADTTACNASQCRTDMAKVEYQFPVDKVHGKISKKHKIGFAHRKASKLNYTQGYGERTTPVSAAEINHRNKFKAVQALARQRMKDPERGPMDMVQWKLDNKGYTTFYGYCFHLEWEAYSEE